MWMGGVLINMKIKNLLRTLNETYKTDINPSDVMSKLSTLNKQTNNNKHQNCKCFGLEDSSGNIIKVYVSSDQSKDFEDALSMELDIDQDMDSREIAEVLYKLHDQFDVLDVEWPDIEEDEENDETSSDEFNADSDNQPPNPMSDPKPNGELDMGEPMGDMGDMGEPDSGSTSALDSVVQVLIANAEADRQKHLADAAESRAREAEAAAKMADAKLKAEEEVADMEAYYNVENQEKKEAKQLAKLAKYRHTVKKQDQESGQFNMPSDALKDQKTNSEQRLDKPFGENPPEGDPSNVNQDIETELDSAGFENEESDVNGPQTTNRRFRDLKAIVKYLNSPQVRGQVHND